MPGISDDETKDVSLHDNTSTSADPKPITTTVDGGKRRLDVSASITGVEIPVDIRTLKQKASDDGELFTVSSNIVSVSGSGEVDFLLMKNPSGSGINFKWDIFRLWFNETSAISGIMRTYHGSAVTSDGTALTGFDENANTGNTATIEWFHTPIISARGTFRQSFIFSNEQQLIHTFDLAHIMKANTNMVITIEKSTGGAADTLFTTWWQEEPE